jgi:hypothetical protein
LEVGFEVIGGKVAEGRMAALGVVQGEIMADFQGASAKLRKLSPASNSVLERL